MNECDIGNGFMTVKTSTSRAVVQKSYNLIYKVNDCRNKDLHVTVVERWAGTRHVCAPEKPLIWSPRQAHNLAVLRTDIL
jgi:hypothetical protein